MKKLLNKKGFTIVELVIVIAVIGILAAVLIPTFSNVIDSAKESAALQEAKNEINAYNSFMASQGVVLGDGTVLRVGEETATATVDSYIWFVYYNNSLHKIEEPLTEIQDKDSNWDIKGILIDDVTYTLDKYIIVDDDVKLTGEYVKAGDDKAFAYLFCNLTKEIEFTDGSNNCTIFGGRVNRYYDKLTAGVAIDEDNVVKVQEQTETPNPDAGTEETQG